MNIFRFATLLMIFLSTFLSAYDSIEVLNPAIKVHKSGFFTTDTDLTPQQALKLATQNDTLSPLPQEAYKLGFGSNNYWFLFETSVSQSDEKLYLDVKTPYVEYCKLYTFEGNNLIQTQNSGYALTIDKRSMQTLPVRFELDKNSTRKIYLLKVETENVMYGGFAFGHFYELNKFWTFFYGLFILVSGAYLIMLVYNLFLFSHTRDMSYLFYCVYVTGVYLYYSFIIGIPMPYYSEFFGSSNFALYCIRTFEFMGLTFFTIHFLELKKLSTNLYRSLLISLSAVLIYGILYSIGFSLHGAVVLVMIHFSLLIFAGYHGHINGSKQAKYFLIATGGALTILSYFMLLVLGILPMSILNTSLVGMALVWDLLMFSFALSYRIKVLQEQRDLAHQRLEMKARFSSIGQTVSSIAHQWRQPLAELSSIVTKLEAKLRFSDKVETDELRVSLKISENIIRHLSGTINTFQGMFYQSAHEKFDLQQSINDALTFLEEMFFIHDIKITFLAKNPLYISGDKSEFLHAIVNILNNSKDAFISNNSLNRVIIINLFEQHNMIIVTIEDTAGGIKLSNIDSIFEPYVSTKAVQGMGIGLFISRYIVADRMKGEISVKNTPLGCIFTLEFEKFISQ